MEAASKTAKAILRAYPDYSKSPPEYLAAIVSLLATYPPEMQARLADLKTGVAAHCSFLPSVASIVEIVGKFEAKDNQFRPAHTGYRRFRSDPLEPKSEESKQYVRELVESFKNGIPPDPLIAKLPPVQYPDRNGNPFKSDLDMDRLVASHDTALAARKSRAA